MSALPKLQKRSKSAPIGPSKKPPRVGPNGQRWQPLARKSKQIRLDAPDHDVYFASMVKRTSQLRQESSRLRSSSHTVVADDCSPRPAYRSNPVIDSQWPAGRSVSKVSEASMQSDVSIGQYFDENYPSYIDTWQEILLNYRTRGKKSCLLESYNPTVCSREPCVSNASSYPLPPQTPPVTSAPEPPGASPYQPANARNKSKVQPQPPATASYIDKPPTPSEPYFFKKSFCETYHSWKNFLSKMKPCEADMRIKASAPIANAKGSFLACIKRLRSCASFVEHDEDSSGHLQGKKEYSQDLEVLLAAVEHELKRISCQSLSERRKSFRELQRRFHPDKNLSQPEAAKLAFQALMDSKKIYLEVCHASG